MSESFYKFSWDMVGDMDIARPNLGKTTRIEVYRLLQYTLREVLEKEYGTEKCDQLFYDAGFLAGKHFFEKFLSEPKDLDEFLKELTNILRELGIGILRMEESEPEKGEFLLTVSEDLDCSGLPDTGRVVCNYDEGFIAGILSKFTNKDVTVKEIDCWCTGDRTCRFKATVAI